MELPPPIDLSRQVGVSSPTNHTPISRSTTVSSERSETRHPDLEIRHHLQIYKTHLEHESTFTNNEICALIDRRNGTDALVDQQMIQLLQNLKTRYNTLQIRLSRVRALLEVL